MNQNVTVKFAHFVLVSLFLKNKQTKKTTKKQIQQQNKPA